MIAKTIPAFYDAKGKKVLHPFERRKGPKPTFPMRRYVSQPLTIHCDSMQDVRKFLLGCRGVSDKEQFGKEDYWLPPEQFEKTKRGDCEDFALWTWRQLLSMGYDARFVAGRSGRYGVGHAWVEFFLDGNCYLLEPQLMVLGLRMPRLSTLRYQPRFSVSWDGKNISYYEHEHAPRTPISFGAVVQLLPEYLSIWAAFWLRSWWRVPRAIWYLLRRFLKGFRWIGKTSQP
jgi:hypothetical protein